MVIGVDFDGTLVRGKDAIEGAREAINELRERGHKIIIFSCNRTEWIKRVLADNDIMYDYVWDGDKPVFDVLIDDRNIAFRGDWKQTLRDVENYKNEHAGIW